MNPMIRWGTGLLLGVFVAGSALADARGDLAQFTKGLTGLDGSFTQQVHDAGGRLKETSTGQVQLSVPRLFRWEYVKPYPQLIVADGDKVWIYDPDLEQVTVRPQGADEQNSPLAALFEPDTLDERFEVKDTGASDGLDWLSLAPKSDEDASFRSARLGFSEAKLVRMEVEDAVGQRTQVKFGEWTRNPEFSADTFNYTPPEGIDVIGER